MNDTGAIKEKLVGTEKAKRRRAELLAELSQAVTEGGPQAVTDAMTGRMGKLVKAFAGQLSELKKQL